jgi:hypothetical protein
VFTLIFWKAIAERGLKTFVEAWAAALVADAGGLIDADWIGSLSIAGMATLIAVLLNIGVGLSTNGSPSLGDAEKLSPVSVKP